MITDGGHQVRHVHLLGHGLPGVARPRPRPHHGRPAPASLQRLQLLGGRAAVAAANRVKKYLLNLSRKYYQCSPARGRSSHAHLAGAGLGAESDEVTGEGGTLPLAAPGHAHTLIFVFIFTFI